MLHVSTASGEEVASLPAESFRTVPDLKRHLRTLRGYPVSLQKFVCDGRLLGDDCKNPAVGEVQLILLANVSKEVDPATWHAAGRELVEYAGRCGHLESARFLLEAGVDKDFRCDVEDCWEPALTVAARHGHAEMVRLLVEEGSNFKQDALFAAATGGHLEVVRLLLDACEDDIALTREALDIAVGFGRAEVLELLFEAVAKPDWQDRDGRTALMHAVANGHTETVRCLVNAGANMDLRNTAGVTALMLAAVYGHTEIARLLVEAGADTEVQDNQGRTAFQHARLRRRRSHAKIAALLQESSPNASGTKAKRPRR